MSEDFFFFPLKFMSTTLNWVDSELVVWLRKMSLQQQKLQLQQDLSEFWRKYFFEYHFHYEILLHNLLFY